jgi:hypothetical protein
MKPHFLPKIVEYSDTSEETTLIKRLFHDKWNLEIR